MINQPTILDILPPEGSTKQVKEALETAMTRTGNEVADHAAMTRLQISMDVVSLLAAKGVRWAVNFARDTLDGKPTQEVVGNVHNTLTVEKRLNLGGLSADQLEQLAEFARIVQQGPTVPALTRDREREV